METGFLTLITDLQRHLKSQLKPLDSFEVLIKSDKPVNLVWIKDHLDAIGHTPVHYEIGLKDNIVLVEIHFEEKDLNKRAEFKKEIANLPEEVTWHIVRTSLRIRFINNNLLINDPLILKKISQRLLYLEEHLGNQIRRLL